MIQKSLIFYVLIVSQILLKSTYSLENNHVKKSVGFIVHTQNIGGKGVYEVYQEMKKLNFDTKIIAIPFLLFWKTISSY